MEGSFILCKANKAAVEVRDLVGLAANARLISGGVIGNIFAISVTLRKLFNSCKSPQHNIESITPLFVINYIYRCLRIM